MTNPEVHIPTSGDKIRWAFQDTVTITWRDMIRTAICAKFAWVRSSVIERCIKAAATDHRGSTMRR